MQNEQKKPALSVTELSERWSISEDQVYKGLRDRSIPSLRIGRRYVIPRAAIERIEASAGQQAVGA